MDEDLDLFIYGQVDGGHVFEGNASYCVLGEEKHYYVVWSMLCDDSDLLIGQFKRDITAWVSAAGSMPTIVVRSWPEITPFLGPFEDTKTDALFWNLHCRMLVVNRFYKDVPPSFMPKPEGEEAQILGETYG